MLGRNERLQFSKPVRTFPRSSPLSLCLRDARLAPVRPGPRRACFITVP